MHTLNPLNKVKLIINFYLTCHFIKKNGILYCVLWVILIFVTFSTTAMITPFLVFFVKNKNELLRKKMLY